MPFAGVTGDVESIGGWTRKSRRGYWRRSSKEYGYGLLSPLIRFSIWLGRRDSSVRRLQGIIRQGWKITIARRLLELGRSESAFATPLSI
jgi:hypothetical protein